MQCRILLTLALVACILFITLDAKAIKHKKHGKKKAHVMKHKKPMLRQDTETPDSGGAPEPAAGAGAGGAGAGAAGAGAGAAGAGAGGAGAGAGAGGAGAGAGAGAGTDAGAGAGTDDDDDSAPAPGAGATSPTTQGNDMNGNGVDDRLEGNTNDMNGNGVDDRLEQQQNPNDMNANGVDDRLEQQGVPPPAAAEEEEGSASDNTINKLQENVHNENWKDVFQEQFIKDILISFDKTGEGDIKANIVNTVKDCMVDTEKCHVYVGMLGISCLKLLVQENWTGPPINMENCEVLNSIIQSKPLNDAVIQHYENDGDDLYPDISYPILLLFADTILIELCRNLHLFPILSFWSVKFVVALLSLIDEVQENHLNMFMSLFQKCQDFIRKSTYFTKTQQAMFYLESSHLLLKFYDYSLAQNCLDEASKILGIQVSLSSALGKRTKFQRKDLPQMRLDINFGVDRETIKSHGEVTEDLPTNLELDNDTLLPCIKFIDADSVKIANVSAIDQAYIISNCVQLRKSKPRDDLTYEELLPYADSVLQAPQSWSVQYKALFLRCITEFSNSRKAERALQQLEELINTYKKTTPKGSERYVLAHCVDLQPKWEHERNYAQLLFSIGLMDSALEIFLRLSIWDDVISCYQRLGKHGKAEEVIRAQLAIRETTTLWCLLGDATLDKQYYEKAWEYSKRRSSRAQKLLGFWYLRRQEFETSIPYFEKSLELNCLQPNVAFSLGCASMAMKELEKGAKAFQHSVGLEPDNFQAWNNLGSCFIRLDQLTKAYNALQQATRLGYNNWRVWENFLLVSTDIGAFEESIHSVHRLIDLERKTIDTAVLQILVDSTIKGEKDFKGTPATRLKQRIQKMFGHITSSITSDSRIWEIYAQLCLSSKDKNEDEKALQFLYKSHRCFTQHTNWEKSEEEVPNVMRVTMKMMEATKLVCSNIEEKPRKLSLYSTTKMSISNLILRLKKAYVEDNNELIASMVDTIKILEEQLTEINNLIENI